MAFFLFSLVTELWKTLFHRHPLLVYAATWTILVAATVAAASLAPEVAFVWTVTSSPFAGECSSTAVRLLLDAPPGEIICIPTELFGHTGIDFLVPPVFATAIIAGAACVVRAIGFWEAEDDGGLPSLHVF